MCRAWISRFLCAFALFLVFSCSETAIVEGVKVDHTLYENLTIQKRSELADLIQRTLKLDRNALGKLTRFDCGGAAGCYDLGFVITQIINQVGETRFLQMLPQQSKESLHELRELIGVGLEYGDNDDDGKSDNTTIERAFPALSRQILITSDVKMKDRLKPM